VVTIIICNISCNDGKHDSLDRFKYTAGSNNYIYRILHVVPGLLHGKSKSVTER